VLFTNPPFSPFSQIILIEEQPAISLEQAAPWHSKGMYMSFSGISPELYTYFVLPLLIFPARICDVSMETIRVICISRGIKYPVPGLASPSCLKRRVDYANDDLCAIGAK
jgi:hypothetical protein